MIISVGTFIPYNLRRFQNLLSAGITIEFGFLLKSIRHITQINRKSYENKLARTENKQHAFNENLIFVQVVI